MTVRVTVQSGAATVVMFAVEWLQNGFGGKNIAIYLLARTFCRTLLCPDRAATTESSCVRQLARAGRLVRLFIMVIG